MGVKFVSFLPHVGVARPIIPLVALGIASYQPESCIQIPKAAQIHVHTGECNKLKMNLLAKHFFLSAMVGVSACLLVASGAAAAVPPTSLPSAADPARIKPVEQTQPTAAADVGINIPKAVPTLPMPKEAKSIHLKLASVKIEGALVFTSEELADIYKPYIGKDITLDTVYMMASSITERYRSAGYFLSLAYVPNQRIRDGVVVIRVVEGYVGKVEMSDTTANNHVLEGYIEGLLAKKPVTSDEVESFLLRVNDLPGYSFRAVLSSLDKAEEGAVKLTLTPEAKPDHGTLTVDNYSSRYLGPHQVSGSYSTSLLPLQQTTISGLNSLPFDKIHYGMISHTIQIAPRLMLELNAGITRAKPGYSLEPFDVESKSIALGVGVNYQLIRQRQENLNIKFGLDGRNTDSDLLGSPIARDRVRAVRLTTAYDTADAWQGYDNIGVILSQGVDGLGASSKGAPSLSRAEAAPDFTKLEVNISRLQALNDNWSVQLAAAGQISSGPLYSSEEFGYGGQSFGRAYDDSEIVGDHGVAASVEVRYGGWKDDLPESITLQPYVFLDSARVWNDDAAQPAQETGTSTGFGIRFATEWKQSGNLGVAFPISRDIAAPLYGASKDGPRLIFRVSQEF